nr:cytochrome d ubiquinol oxidase subunit II [Pseudenhygromyxa sp. WMMC2535]
MVFALLGVAVIAYALTAGADFGGGLWDLLAGLSPADRRERQRALIAEAIAPIWEVNHIWMIFVVVVLFTVFPRAFAAVSTALHIPILLALFGVVLRGSAFVFRAYGLQPDDRRARWGRIFAWASTLTPIFLGTILAALSSGQLALTLEPEGGVRVESGFLAGWTSALAWAVGVFTLALFALLAAVYLAREAEVAGDEALRDGFRRRALITEVVAGALAALVLVIAATAEDRALFDGLLHASWSIPAQVLTALSAAGVMIALVRGRLRAARVLAMTQVGLVVLGWGLAMNGHLILPDMHIADAGAEPAVLASLPWVLLGGSVIFAPALFWLFRIFKSPKVVTAPR